MVSSSEAILNKNSTFTADSLNNTLQGAKSKYLDSVSLTVGALQDGGSAPSIANLLGLVNRVTVSVAGTVEMDLSLTDLYALNNLWLANEQRTKISAGDNQQAWISGIQMPIWFPPVANETQISFYYSAVTNADNTTLSATANYQASIPRRTALHYQKFEKNTNGVDSSALGNWQHDFQAIGNVSGILFNNTTVSGGSTTIDNETLTQIGIEVDGIQNVLFYEIHELGSLTNNYTGQMNSNLADSPNSLAILDNYYWLPIKEMIPRNSWVKINAMAGVNAEQASDIVIQQIPF
tara:strand:+ start:349 stop:1227 length:879 start_codon:yes stop_codon:yes gene_type:complete